MYTKGKWTVNSVFQILGQDKVVATIQINEDTEANAHLIAAAVNACISVNPKNPQAVAESIKDTYEALKHSRAILGSLKPNDNVAKFDIDNQLLEISKALAKAEVRK